MDRPRDLPGSAHHAHFTDTPATAMAPPARGPRQLRATTAAALCLVAALAGGAFALGAQATAAPPGKTAKTTDTTASQAASVGSQAGHPVAEVAREVGPAVVAIEVSGTIDTAGFISPSGSGFDFQGAGSGVIVDPDGLILTNRHVVGDASDVTVYLADGRQFDGTVEGLDTFTDLAVVSIDATDLPAAQMGDSSAIEVGEPAIAIGNPQGDLPGSVTAGVVSALERGIVAGDQTGMQAPEAIRHLIQHDAAINPGNSGGPLLDDEGRIIGINTAMAGGAQGIGFAIPIDLAKPIVRQVQDGQPLERPYIGVYFTDVSAQLAADQDLPVSSGALIGGEPNADQGGIIAGGPAAAAGLKDGDVVTAIDGEPVDAEHQLDVILLQHEPGDTVTLTVLRNGKERQLELTLGTRPASTAQ